MFFAHSFILSFSSFCYGYFITKDKQSKAKGKNFYNFQTRRAILENLKGVIDVIAFDDSDNTACDGIRKARKKYPNAELVFANGGDRTKNNIPEIPVCKECGVEIVFGVGGENKANSSSWILQKYNEK